MKEQKILATIFATFLAFLLIEGARNWIHRSRIKNLGFSYSIATIRDYYFVGNVSGKVIQYPYEGTVYRTHCASQLCKEAKIGNVYFVKIFLKDPTVFEVIDIQPDPSDTLNIPFEGWKKIPEKYTWKK